MAGTTGASSPTHAPGGVGGAARIFSPFVGIVIDTPSCLMGYSNMLVALLARHAVDETELRVLLTKALLNCSLMNCLKIFVVPYAPILAIALSILALTGFSSNSDLAAVGYAMILWLVAIVVFKSRALRFVGKRRIAGPAPG